MGTTKLSTFIRENKGPIVSEWEAFARTLAPGTSMDVNRLRDHAEAMLVEIATDIETPQSAAEQSEKSKGRRDGGHPGTAAIVAAEHGHDRAGIGFSVVEMMAEFRALRASVARLWIAQSPEFGRDELEALIRFNEAIDQAIAYSLERFARDIDATRQRFLAILGHDLRNPLSTVSTASSFLMEVGELAPAHAQLVETIQRATTRMTHLVADMLELALTRLGDSMTMQRETVDVGNVVEAVVEEVRASDHQATIEVCAEGNLVGEWDAARLAQALTNLIGNAVQHGDRQAPIQVSTRGTEREVEIEVRNSGPTIPGATLDRIFDGAQTPGRADGDRRHLGLGLFIVRKIVEGHGGSIDVESANAKTAFRIRLPRAA